MNLFISIFTVIFAETQMGALNQLLDIAHPYVSFDLLEPREPDDYMKEPDMSKEPDEDLQSFLNNMKVFSI